MTRRVLIAGFGIAAQRLLEELAPLEADLQVTVIGDEPALAYDRIKLSTVLAQDKAAAAPDLSLKNTDWHQAHGHVLRLGEKAVSLDVEKRLVFTDQGALLPYDDLVIATGSQPILPPLPGIGFEGVHVFRRLSDCQALREEAEPGLKAIVIGGGLLGLEAAKGLLNLGCQVTVLHLADRLMERQLDTRAAAFLQADLERQGIRFELEASTEALLGGPHIEGLRLADGRILETSLVVFAIGVRPEVELARNAGLMVKRGIVVDDHLRSSAEGVWALGECAEHRGVAYGLVAPLYEQAATLAKRLAGMENAPYTGSKIYTRLKVAGLEVFSCGDLSPCDGKDLIIEDSLGGLYKRALFQGKRLRGAILYGDSRASTQLLKALDSEDAVSDVRTALGFGGGVATAPLAGMKEADLVCNCNQVSLGSIRNAIRTQGCRSVEQVQACTAASSSCGSCKGLVQSILKEAIPQPLTIVLPPKGGAVTAIPSAVTEGVAPRGKGLQMTGARS